MSSLQNDDQLTEYEFDDDDQGGRLDAVLKSRSEEYSRSFIQKMISGGNVLINGIAVTDKNYRIRTGDVCSMYVEPPEVLSVEPEDIPLDIVYEDDDVIIINKEKGMVVHPAPGNYTGTLVNALMYRCESLSSINGVVRPGIVHRIDKDTSGLLMVAKNDKAHNSLAEQLKEHSIKREYRAVVINNFKEDSGTIDKPVGRDQANRLKMAVNYKNGKRAVTHFQVIERMGKYCHIACRLETGRTHQIRVHMASINHALAGDSVYGQALLPGVTSQVLHAKTIGFVHPSTGKYIEFDSELPEYFKNVLKGLGAENFL